MSAYVERPVSATIVQNMPGDSPWSRLGTDALVYGRTH